jgi:aldose 1-epimerase
MIDVGTAGTLGPDALEPGAPVVGLELASDELSVRLIGLGAAIAGVRVPDMSGVFGDVHLGLPDLAAYADRARNPHLGASIGRVANRISGASFDLDGQRYDLPANNGANTLHGGPDGWDRHVWELLDANGDDAGGTAVFRIVSPDGDQGFPGRVTATATFAVQHDTLQICYSATTEAATVLSMTNHGYWNLDGGGEVASHRVTIAADRFLPVDDTGIPTGGLVAVDATAFDLRDATVLGPAMTRVPGGFDHCFAVRGTPGELRPTALLETPGTGRWLAVSTDQPGVQLYTGNNLTAPFEVHGAVSLETQAFPDTPNRAELGSIRLDPGATYHNVTEYRFGTGLPPKLIQNA